jgi:anaerobic selenocysteine-containing dehydrogenase
MLTRMSKQTGSDAGVHRGGQTPASTQHVIDTACPLDCPDACSLAVTVSEGCIVEIDGSSLNAPTGGYICAKVRKFGDRVYGEARLHHPAVRSGPKGQGRFSRVSWDEAIEIIANQMIDVRDKWGGEAILPFSYGGSNGLLTQDTLDAILFRRFGSSRLARTVCAAPTGTVAQAMYGKMPCVTYEDYPEARLIILWGVNPSTSGIHLVPYVRQAQKQGAQLVVIDPRATPLARQADLHLAPKPGTDVAIALSIHRHLFEEGLADARFIAEHTTGADRLRERAAAWTFERAARTSGVPEAGLRQLADDYASASPALIRCGWGLERNRNGGNAVMSVLSLPAVAGKFGVRGGGYSMSNSGAWNITRPWLGTEPVTRVVNMNKLGRALTEFNDPPIKMLFVYNCNPVVTMPDQQRVLQGMAREDLFTIVFDQVMTDTAAFADLVLPATTFLEAYDFARGYGPISLQLVRPVIDAVGESRSNPEVFGELARRLDVVHAGEPDNELDMLLQLFRTLPGDAGAQIEETGRAAPPFGFRPVQFVDVMPRTIDGKVDLFPAALDAEAPGGLYTFQPDPASDRFPLALISPASDKTISSTLGELSRPAVALLMNPVDAAPRGLKDSDPIRVFNELGEVQCAVKIDATIREGTISLPKGLWRKSTWNRMTANVLVPDSLTDLGAGACFNDARVQVARLEDAQSRRRDAKPQSESL